MISLVSGISSVGKSTFISYKRAHEEWKKTTPVVMASKIETLNLNFPKNSFILHYSILRPLHKKNIELAFFNTKNDPAVLSEIIKSSARITAYVLVCPLTMVIDRMLSRKFIEPAEFQDDSTARVYPREHCLELMRRYNLINVYIEWFEFLSKHNINHLILDSSSDAYNMITSPEAAINLLYK